MSVSVSVGVRLGEREYECEIWEVRWGISVERVSAGFEDIGIAIRGLRCDENEMSINHP